MELISCICLTLAGREAFLRRAVDCFRRQTYHRRELVIVNDPDCEWVHDCVRGLPWDQVQIVTPVSKLTVGAKRNEGCAFSSGDYIALWDDDDYSAPERLWRQYEMLCLAKKAVTALGQIYFTNEDCTRWWLSEPGMQSGIDTSLFFKRDFWEAHPFRDEMLRQDFEFMQAAKAAGEFLIAGDPRLMFATNHAGNTCKERKYSYGPNNELKNFKWKD
jgi:O-antigen biosynthesis protein